MQKPDAFSKRITDQVREGRFVVSRDIFTDEALFEREIKQIFEGGWVYLAHESQLPAANDFLTTAIGGKSILLTRTPEGAIKAFLNTCPHRGTALARTGHGNKRAIVCPYHGWTFNTDGKNVHIKDHESGAYSEAFEHASHDLRALPRVEEYRGFVFGSLSADVPPLREHLGPAAAFIDVLVDQSPDGVEVIGGNTTYRYRGNWKLQLENGVDGYHFTTVHQNYVRVLKQRSIRVEATGIAEELRSGFSAKARLDSKAGWYDLSNGHTLFWFSSTAPAEQLLWPEREAIAARVGEVRANWMVNRNRNLAIFPNVQFMDQNSTQIRVIRPIAPGLTEVKSYCFAPRGENADVRARRIRRFEDFFSGSGLATPDDLAIFEGMQVGLEAGPSVQHGYDRGMTRIHFGADEEAQALGIEPVACSDDIHDEMLYHGMYRQWAKMMAKGEE
jgi:benzoate/toluate 1,2-dioxygenase alpha subunit